MGRATSPLQLHGQADAVSPMLLAGAGEGYLVARVLEHDWGERLGEVAIEESLDGGRSWPVALTTAHGVRPDEHGAIWADYAPGVDLGLRFIRARAKVAGALTARLEIEALPVDFPPYAEPHHSVGFVQSARAGSAGASQLDVTLSTPTANNLLLSYGSINNASMTVTSCQQDPTGTPVSFTALQATLTGGGANTLRDRVFFLAACTTNTTVRTVFSGSSALGVVVHEISGHNPTGPIHGYATGVGSSTALLSGSITTTQANCMLVGFGKTPNTAVTWTPGTSYTIRQPPSGSQREASEDRNVTATGTYTASFTAGTSDDWHCWLVAIQEPVAPIWQNLQAYWKLDEASGTRIDNFSGLCNLTDVNTVTSTTGLISTAAQFTAANSESLSRASDAFIGGGDIDWTFNFWLNWQSAPSGFPIPISKDNAGGDGDFGLFWDDPVGKFKWEVFGGVGRAACGSMYPSGAGIATTGVWQMITLDHSATTNTIGIRINGGSRDSSATSGPAGLGAQPFLFSGRNGSLFITALIDEAAYFKRSITDAEATQLYNSGAGLSFPNAPATAGGIPFFLQEDLMSGGTQRQSGGKQ